MMSVQSFGSDVVVCLAAIIPAIAYPFLPDDLVEPIILVSTYPNIYLHLVNFLYGLFKDASLVLHFPIWVFTLTVFTFFLGYGRMTLRTLQSHDAAMEIFADMGRVSSFILLLSTGRFLWRTLRLEATPSPYNIVLIPLVAFALLSAARNYLKTFTKWATHQYYCLAKRRIKSWFWFGTEKEVFEPHWGRLLAAVVCITMTVLNGLILVSLPAVRNFAYMLASIDWSTAAGY